MLKYPEYLNHLKINDYLVKLSDRNIVKMYLEEIHDVSLGKKPINLLPRKIILRFINLGVLKIYRGKPRVKGISYYNVIWDRVWDILG